MRYPVLTALGLASLLSCDNAAYEPTAPRTETPVISLAVQPERLELEVGERHQLSAVAVDASGAVIREAYAAWGTSDSSRLTVSPDGVAHARSAGTAAITARVATVTAQAVVTVVPPTVETVDVLPSSADIATGDSVHFTVHAQDSRGQPVESAGAHWESSDSTVARVGSDGVVVGQAAGTAEIVTRVGGARASAYVFVTWAPASSMTLTPQADTTFVGQRASYTVRAADAAGNLLPAADVEWKVSPARIATVSPQGIVSTLETGEATVTARLDSVSASSLLTVLPSPGLSIDSVHPRPLSAGGQGVAYGRNLGSPGASVSIRVRGIEAEILSRNESEILFGVPPFPAECSPPVREPVEVRVLDETGERMDSILHPVATVEQTHLDRGQALANQDAREVGCVELPAEDARYVISVFHATSTLSSSLPVRLSGRGPDTDDPAPTHPALQSTPSANPTDQHGEIIEQSRALAARYPRAVRSHAIPDIQRAPTPGDEWTLNIPKISQDLCTPIETRARVAHVTNHAVILEDVDNASAGTLDERYRTLGAEFENTMFPLLNANFGDPLAYDANLDDNGRILMLFSDVVTREGQGRIAGFVTSADFLDSSSCASSNEAEIFYAQAPETSGSASSWHRRIRSTVLHEVKHLTSYAERFARTSGHPTLEERWLEEATAMTAEELWVRATRGLAPHSNLTYEEVLYCELNTSVPECAGTPSVMTDHFYFLAQYYREVEMRTPLGPAATGDNSFYGSGWQLVRWALDHHATSDAEFLTALTRETTLTGIENVLARASTTHAELLGDYTLAIATDDLPGFTPKNNAHSLPSWNTRDVFEGLNEVVGQVPEFSQAFPLAVRTAAGSFDIEGTVRAGSAMFADIETTTAGSQFLELRSLADQPTSAGWSIIRTE